MRLLRRYMQSRTAPALIGAGYLLFLIHMTIEGHALLHVVLPVLALACAALAVVQLLRPDTAGRSAAVSAQTAPLTGRAETAAGSAQKAPASPFRMAFDAAADLLGLVGRHLPLYILAFFADRVLESDYRYTSQIPTCIMRILAEIFLVEGALLILHFFLRGKGRAEGASHAGPVAADSFANGMTGNLAARGALMPGDGDAEAGFVPGAAAARFAAVHADVIRVVFYAAFIVCYLYRFFLSTMFTSVAGPFYNIFGLLMRISVMLLLVVAAFAIPGMKSVWQLVLALASLLVGFLYKANDGKYAVFLLTVLIAAAAGQSAVSILRAAFVTGLAFLLAALAASLTGAIPDFIYMLNSRGNIPQHAFGIIYYTDCSAHWMFLTAMYAMLRRAEGRWLKRADLFLAAAVLVFNVIFIRGRANIVCLVLLVLIMIGHEWNLLRIPGQGKFSSALRKGIKGVLILIYPLFFALSCWTVHFYITHGKRIPLQRIIRKFTSVKSLKWRCWYVIRALRNHPIRLFGSNIEERGVAGTIKKNRYSFYIDNSYMRMLLICGVAFLVLFLLVMVVLSVRLFRAGLVHWVLVLAVIALSGLIEHHLIDPGYNIFPMLLLAVLPGPCARTRPKRKSYTS